MILLGGALFAQRNSHERSDWNQPVPPFRIIGNIYYVGVSGVTSFLVTTPQGHILLDGGFPETAPLIEKNIAALGFRIQDVKVLLNSHAHYDHGGGMAELKRLSGGQMIASRADAVVLESGGRVSFEGWKNSWFPAVKVDRLIADGETVQLGDVKLTALLTPGHTKGCTTWTMPVTDSGKTYHVVFFCSTSVPGYRLVDNPKYPQIASDYERTFARLRQIPCDVFLAPHGGFFHLNEKRARSAKGGANPFINPAEFHAFLDDSERDFQRELKKQQGDARK
ncbi:MAG: subclass B3 metallo-beta-lactamase [Acidobacteriia bacterium]|nr:subclass B3 metallo-beta-lactamase [Terriglobia bacterium]